MRNPARALSDKLGVEAILRTSNSVESLRGAKLMSKVITASIGLVTGVGATSNAMLIGDEHVTGHPEPLIDVINSTIDVVAVGGIIMPVVVGGLSAIELRRLHEVASDRIQHLNDLKNENN